MTESAVQCRPLPHLPAVIPQPIADSSEHVGRDWSKSSVPERRCVRIKKDGEQCRNAALRGTTVCRYHGGAAKHIKLAARARIENAQDRLAKELLGMAIDPSLTPAVKLSAIKDALDRGGLRAPNEVVLSAGATPGFEEVFEGIYSGPRSGDDSTNGLETQVDSSRFANDPNTAPVDPDIYADDPEQAHRHSGSDRPADRESYERRERRQSQRASRQNGSQPVTGYDAMRAVNELRALPPGRGD